MKSFMFLAIVLAAFHVNAGEYQQYVCEGKVFRSPGHESKVNSRFDFTIRQNQFDYTMTNVTGHVQVEDYYSVFSAKDVSNNTKYRPSKYHSSIAFVLKEIASNEVDGGGMNGNFILSDDRKEAHYVFQSGDHLGGTIDYKCTAL